MRKELASSIAAAIVFSTSIPARAQELPVPPTYEFVEETQQLQTQIQEKYDIILYNNVTHWDRSRITTLSHILSSIPPSFYEPTKDGRKASFELTPFISFDSGASCACGPIAGDERVDTILLTTSLFNPEYPERSFETIAHELIHRRMPIAPMTSEPSLRNPESYTSPWFESINRILGGPYSQTRHEIHEIMLTRSPQILLELPQRETAAFNSFTRDIRYATGYNPNTRKPSQYYDHPIELIPVFGQHVLPGKNHFLRMCEVVFGDEKSTQLYDFMRDVVFDGWEYKNYRPLTFASRRPAAGATRGSTS